VNEAYAERIVRAFVVAIMNSRIYFSTHQRVIDASDEAAFALEGHFEENPKFQIAIKESLLIFNGKPLYDLSIYAHQLTKYIRKHHGWGMHISPGVTSGEIRSFVEFMITTNNESVQEANMNLLKRDVNHINIEENPVVDNLDKGARVTKQEEIVIEDMKISQKVYTEALSVLQEIMVGLHQKKRISFNSAYEIAENMTNSLDENRNSFIALTTAKDYDAYTFNHSINVCIYAATLAESLTTDPETVVRIAQAALLHDVGKLLIPEEILNKKELFNEEDRKIMEQHTVLGAKILIESEGSHDMAVNVAFGHHLRYDRKGYPKVPADIMVDPVVDMINVIDFYEAITARRPYKDPFPPAVAAEMLLDGSGTQFNPVCVEAFLSYFGAFPISTDVLLSNGMSGLVVSNNPDDPFRPCVKITHDISNESVSSGPIVDTSKIGDDGEHQLSIVGSMQHSDLYSLANTGA